MATDLLQVAHVKNHHDIDLSTEFTTSHASTEFSDHDDSSFLAESRASSAFLRPLQADNTNRGHYPSSSSTNSRALQPSRELVLAAKVESLSANRIKFRDLQVQGRKQEKEVLATSLNNCYKGAREIIFIHGGWGSGKSALASTLETTVKRLGGTMVHGRFDPNQQPYTGLAGACHSICSTILQLNDRNLSCNYNERFLAIRRDLTSSLGSDLGLLAAIFPELGDLVGMDNFKAQWRSSDNEKAKTSLHHAFRKFFRVITKHMGPVVMVLKDIQHSDSASREVVRSLVTDVDNSCLLVVALYQNDELVEEDHPTLQMQREMETSAAQFGAKVTDMPVGALDVEDTCDILTELMSCDKDKGMFRLADICRKRTSGNAFLLLMFVKGLADSKLLRFDLTRYKWQWDETEILTQTHVPQNVVEKMKEDLTALPSCIQYKLSIASLLGQRFHTDTLRLVCNCLGEKFCGENESQTWLGTAVAHGFIESLEGSSCCTYQWVHEKVQVAATSLISDHDLKPLKRQIGEALLQELDESNRHAMVFVIVDLLNAGIPEDEKEQTRLARLNLEAAKRASDCCGYEAAANYAYTGINLLPPERWDVHFDLSLELFSISIATDYSCGNIERMQLHIDEVDKQEKCTMLQRTRVYGSRILFLGGVLRHQEAVDLICTLLRNLGYPLPRGSLGMGISTIVGLLKLRGRIKRMRSSDILQLPTMSDDTDVVAMGLLVQLGQCAYRCENKLYLPLAVLASVRLTLEKGVCVSSPPSFGLLGLMATGVLKDFEFGKQCADMAQLLIHQNANFRLAECRTLMLVNGFARPWVEPFSQCQPSLWQGYNVGLSTGDAENAMICLFHTITIGFQMGRKLSDLEADCRKYSIQMKEFQRVNMWTNTKSYWLATTYLLGQDVLLPPLDGIDSSLSMVEWLHEHKDDATLAAVIKMLQSYLYVIMGEFEEGAKLAIEKGDSYSKTNPAHLTIMGDTFSRALNLFAMARKTRLRKYRVPAQKLHSTIKKWARSGNPNVGHYDKLLNAEAAALHGDLDAAEGWYQSAVVLSSRSGFVGDAAMATERYGEFLLNEMHNTNEAGYKLEEACRIYGEWGADRKVQLLRSKYASLWSQKRSPEMPKTHVQVC